MWESWNRRVFSEETVSQNKPGASARYEFSSQMWRPRWDNHDDRKQPRSHLASDLDHPLMCIVVPGFPELLEDLDFGGI